MRRRDVVLISAGAVLFLACAGCCAGLTLLSKTGKQETPIASVRDIELWNEYEANTLAADQKYKGKTIELSGLVREVKADPQGRYYVGIAVVHAGTTTFSGLARMTVQERKWWNEGYPPNIVAYIAKGQEGAFAGLKEDSRVSIIGRVLGPRPAPDAWKGRAIVLDDCRSD